MTALPIVVFALLMLNERRRCKKAIAGMSAMRDSVLSSGGQAAQQQTEAVVIDLSTGQRLVADPKLVPDTYAVGGAR
jgi:hypothetical protein